MGNVNTYDSATEAEADKSQQKALLKALNAWDRALRRDECGAWTIIGSRGTIHTWGDGQTWALFVACHSSRHWTATKARVAFCKVTQDGEEEGCLRLSRLPTPDQAEAIRDALGVQKRREISAGVLERLRSFSFERKSRSEPVLEPNIAIGDRPGNPGSHLDRTPILDAEPAKCCEVGVP
jgi:hypothetical protein